MTARAIVFRGILECIVIVAAWPLAEGATSWRYMLVVGGVSALRIWFGRPSP